MHSGSSTAYDRKREQQQQKGAATKHDKQTDETRLCNSRWQEIMDKTNENIKEQKSRPRVVYAISTSLSEPGAQVQLMVTAVRRRTFAPTAGDTMAVI